MRDYELETAVIMQPFIQPCTCKMGSSIFAAIIQLKFASTTRDSLPSMPPTERKTEKMFPLLVEMITVLILLDFIPPIQELCHWLKYLGFCISVAKFDVDDGVSQSAP